MRIACLGLTILLLACGDAGSPASMQAALDPRCRTLCEEPGENRGFYSYCDRDSVEQCLALCGARIANQNTLCTSCLLERAYFESGGVTNAPFPCEPPRFRPVAECAPVCTAAPAR
jgi:hypothetical protein